MLGVAGILGQEILKPGVFWCVDGIAIGLSCDTLQPSATLK